MSAEAFRFLDIGGGPDIFRDPEIMSDLRSVRLARENPQGEYIIFDFQIVPEQASALSSQIPNLHFIIGKIELARGLPLGDKSIDRVEMNFMWTPLTNSVLDKSEDESKKMHNSIVYGRPFIDLYEEALREAVRVLKPGKTLAITEKHERMQRIRRLLSRDSWLDMDGFLISNLGLKYDWPNYKLVEMNDPNMTIYAQNAVNQREYAKKSGDTREAEELLIYTLELYKKE